MHLNCFSVKGLFGLFEHSIVLRSDERATILHGRNGIGKTTLLELVAAFFRGQYDRLATTSFEELTLEFDDGSELHVKRIVESQEQEESPVSQLSVVLRDPSHNVIEFEVPRATQPSEKLEQELDHFVPLGRISTNRWMDGDEIIDTMEVLRRYSEQLPDHMKRMLATPDEPQWLIDLRKQFPIHFVQTHRLFVNPRVTRSARFGNRSSQGQSLAVVAHAQQLAQAIQARLAHYATLSQSLDRSFPARLMKLSSQGYGPVQDTDIGRLRQKLDELEKRRKPLRDAGLLVQDDDPDFQVPEQLDAVSRNTLTIYAEDVEKKLDVLDELATRIELFRKIVNERFDYKKMNIDPRAGFVFTTLGNGDRVPLNRLSAGEQHELVLLYQLLFETQPGTLVLIDEPEISFHIEWQQNFLKDFLAIAELVKFEMLIATHSADIIHNRWDLAVSLKGPA